MLKKKQNKKTDWKEEGSEVGYKCAVKWYGARILISQSKTPPFEKGSTYTNSWSLH